VERAGYCECDAGVVMPPYKSEKQRKWAHSPAGTKALGGKEKVKEWDRESKGKKLPERAPKRGGKGKKH
jgi:hypothetical protein